jgi:hypothetical protein
MFDPQIMTDIDDDTASWKATLLMVLLSVIAVLCIFGLGVTVGRSL